MPSCGFRKKNTHQLKRELRQRGKRCVSHMRARPVNSHVPFATHARENSRHVSCVTHALELSCIAYAHASLECVTYNTCASQPRMSDTYTTHAKQVVTIPQLTDLADS
jgi:hypothetical protein